MNYILGGGIVGAIVAYYHPHFKIITRETLPKPGPMILKKCDTVDKFLKKADLHNRYTKKYNCGVYLDGKITQEWTEDTKTKYLMKTRGRNWRSFRKSGMNDGIKNFFGYDLNTIYSIIIEKLLERGQIIYGEIFQIEPRQKFIRIFREKSIRKYSVLVNTIPAFTFEGFADGNSDIKNKDIYIYEISLSTGSVFHKMLMEYDFVYFPEKDIPYYRLSIMNDKYYMESMEDIDDYDNTFVEKVGCLRGMRFVGKGIARGAKILNLSIPRKYKDVVNIGRYAENNNTVRTHNIIERMEKDGLFK